jgi:cytochrome c oxidase assembly protein subunit 15
MHSIKTYQGPAFNLLKRLAVFTLIFSLSVVILGASTRLKDAGLGCPDWPGCYGQLLVPQHPHAVNHANMLYPERPVEEHKAWYEMIHRYLAGSLGLFIFALAAITLKRHRQERGLVALTLALVGVVIFQALLGMWTVTMKLFPTVVMGHLLGGFTTVALLALLVAKLSLKSAIELDKTTYVLARICWLAVMVQVALGGWTAANYAATVCSQLPICEAGWWQHLNLSGAFKFWGHGTDMYEYAPHLTPDIKITIHVLHRIGAIFVGCLLLILILRLAQQQDKLSSLWALGLGLLTLAQIGLGIANVQLNLPLAIAVAHNLGGCLLIAALTVLNCRVISYRKRFHYAA